MCRKKPMKSPSNTNAQDIHTMNNINDSAIYENNITHIPHRGGRTIDKYRHIIIQPEDGL